MLAYHLETLQNVLHETTQNLFSWSMQQKVCDNVLTEKHLWVTT